MSWGNCISALMRTMVRPTLFGLLVGVTRTHPRPVSGAGWAGPWSYWLEQLQDTKINITVRAFQTKHILWSRMPHCAGSALSAFRSLYKHNSRAASINALKANDNNYIQNNYSKIIIIPQKWKYYIYEYIHIHSVIGDVSICNTEIAFCSTVITVRQHGRHDVSNHQFFTTGSGYGLAPNRRQAITWTNETSTLSHRRRNHV